MRLHPFEPVKRDGNYPQFDVEYIDDFHPVFKRVCQIDNATERALVTGAMVGYQEGTYGEVFLETGPRPGSAWPGFFVEVPNKGYIAMWAEENFGGEPEMLVWGVYSHDDKKYLVKASLSDLKIAVDRSTRFGKRIREGLNRI